MLQARAWLTKITAQKFGGEEAGARRRGGSSFSKRGFRIFPMGRRELEGNCQAVSNELSFTAGSHGAVQRDLQLLGALCTPNVPNLGPSGQSALLQTMGTVVAWTRLRVSITAQKSVFTHRICLPPFQGCQ